LRNRKSAQAIETNMHATTVATDTRRIMAFLDKSEFSARPFPTGPAASKL
jgi:hypothetical protein